MRYMTPDEFERVVIEPGDIQEVAEIDDEEDGDE